MCDTAPQALPRRSVTSSSGSTIVSHDSRRLRVGDLPDDLARLLQQSFDGGSDVDRLDRAEARQPGKVEEGIRLLFHRRLPAQSGALARRRPARAIGATGAACMRRSAASTVLTSSMVIVIGPTPPGTGEIQPATSFTPSKSTSPASLPSGVRLVPTSMTTAPGLTMSAVTRLRLPTAATSTSAWRVIGAELARLRVRDRDGGVGGEQQHRHRLADHVRAAEHDRVAAGRPGSRSTPASSSRRTACTSGSAACPSASGRRSSRAGRRRPCRRRSSRGSCACRGASAAATARGCRAPPRPRSAARRGRATRTPWFRPAAA